MSPALPRATAASRRDNDIDLEPDELGRDLGEALVASLRPAILDRDGAALDPAEFAQPLHKGGDPLAPGRRRARAQEPDGRQLARLLRARRERPRRRRAAEQRDELAPFQLIELHRTSRAQAGQQDIEFARISQEVLERFATCRPLAGQSARPGWVTRGDAARISLAGACREARKGVEPAQQRDDRQQRRDRDRGGDQRLLHLVLAWRG